MNMHEESNYQCADVTPVRQQRCTQRHATAAEVIEQQNQDFAQQRLRFLEQQAMDALKTAASHFENPVFPCALIAGDVVILHLLHKAGLLDKGAQGSVTMRRVLSVASGYAFGRGMLSRHTESCSTQHVITH